MPAKLKGEERGRKIVQTNPLLSSVLGKHHHGAASQLGAVAQAESGEQRAGKPSSTGAVCSREDRAKADGFDTKKRLSWSAMRWSPP